MFFSLTSQVPPQREGMKWICARKIWIRCAARHIFSTDYVYRLHLFPTLRREWRSCTACQLASVTCAQIGQDVNSTWNLTLLCVSQ